MTNHIYPYGDIRYPILTTTIWDIVLLISAISMGDRGYQLSCIPSGILDMWGMGYPTSHPNDYEGIRCQLCFMDMEVLDI